MCGGIQSRRQRQQVVPLPPLISLGNIRQGTPLLSTQTMPANVFLFGIRGLPPFSLGGSGGKSGSMIFHNPSLTSVSCI
jgi:hypothetical protein